MPVIDQKITDDYAIYNGDCIEVMSRLPKNSVHLSIYSPPFMGLYIYSSNPKDLSNARSYEEFMEHYGFVIRDLHRLTMPSRVSCVHVMDVPGNGANLGGDTIDFPGDVIRLHKKHGWHWVCRYHVWKEPLAVRNRTMAKSLAHRQIVEDSVWCDNAAADQLLVFRKPGKNANPITHPHGLKTYLGAREVPRELNRFRNWQGKQTENRLSHWIWRQYASAFWDDVRLNKVLKFKEARDPDDEKHMHPLQLDVIGRAVTLWSNPGEAVLTPFMGVGSEVYQSVRMGRKAIGCELKPTYYRQAVENIPKAYVPEEDELPMYLDTEDIQGSMFDDVFDQTLQSATPEEEEGNHETKTS